MSKTLLSSVALASLLATPAFAVSLDFEDLVAGTSYVVGDSFTTGGVNVSAQGFVWAGGTFFTGGSATVFNAGIAGGSGQDMGLNNITLDFALGSVSNLQLGFGEFGGNLNLTVNGDFYNFENFIDLDGLTLGGALMTVDPGTGDGNDTGFFTLTGATISQFSIGGQELWIDNLTADPSEVPLPASLVLLGIGLGGLGALKRRPT